MALTDLRYDSTVLQRLEFWLWRNLSNLWTCLIIYTRLWRGVNFKRVALISSSSSQSHLFKGINKLSNSLAYENYASATHTVNVAVSSTHNKYIKKHNIMLPWERLDWSCYTYNTSLFAGGVVYHGWQQKLGTKVTQHPYIMRNMKRKIQQIWLFLEKNNNSWILIFWTRTFISVYQYWDYFVSPVCLTLY